MSQKVINHNPDLKRLRDEGYCIEISPGNFLLVKGVPYVNSKKEIAEGTLISNLTMAGGKTAPPDPHVVHFIGDQPCHANGTEIAQIKHPNGETKLDEGLVANRSFSFMLDGGYPDYFVKMDTYVNILTNAARAIDLTANAKKFLPVASTEDDSPFLYFDTASSRAGITAVTRKLELSKVAIVGVGGTGSYILDLVAKTPVNEIHLFDADKFLSHNAFRAPGAASLAELEALPTKVAYLTNQYSRMRRRVIPHEYFIDGSNVDQLREMNFVFLSLDKGKSKRIIVERLQEWNIPFVVVGMGVVLVDDALVGTLRVTTSSEKKTDHVLGKNRIAHSDEDGEDIYAENIQIADLNALNAALAVIKWKKHFGFYGYIEDEHYAEYVISGNHMNNEDCP